MVHTIECLLLSSKRKIGMNSKKWGKLRIFCPFHCYQRNTSREGTHHCYCSGGCYCNRTLENIKQEIHNSIWETAEILEKLIKLPTLMFTIFFFLWQNYVNIFSFSSSSSPSSSSSSSSSSRSSSTSSSKAVPHYWCLQNVRTGLLKL